MQNNTVEKTAPIVLFTYNRPEHTLRTLTALQQNKMAVESTLYIYSDAAKDKNNAELVQNVNKVREVIRMEDWCGKVEIIEAADNKGLAQSIKAGVTEIVSRYGKVIVMEDDLIISSNFLTYMNKALDFYQDYAGVFSISGYCLPPKKLTIPEDYDYDVFVSLRNSSWGWATWSNRWEKIDWEVSCYKAISTNPQMKEAFNRGGDDVFKLLDMQHKGELNIWSIQFTVAHFVNHAVSIVPTQSYVDNIGHDGSGENCHIGDGLQNGVLSEKENIKFLDIIYEDKRLINAFYSSYYNKKRPLWQKMINRLSRIMGGKNVFVIKKKIYY